MYCNHKTDIVSERSEISELEEGLCPVGWAKDCVADARHENCGKSVMCRDGMTQLLVLLNDIISGKGQSGDLDLIKDICTVIADTKGCAIALKTAGNVLYSMEHYADEWDMHCRRKRCSALVCDEYYSVYIDPALCQGCHDCVKNAPDGAIALGDGMISVITDDRQLKNSQFISCCPNGAIKKAGAVKPKLPDAPIPIGSFEAGGRRRRR